MKSLFKNYNFTFDKNERKIITNFCKQIIKQLESNEGSNKDIKTFESIIDKIGASSDSVKLTKD